MTNHLEKGKVLKSTGKRYIVELKDGSIAEVGIRGRIRLKGIKTTNPIAVGDEVTLQFTDGKDGVITDVSPRRNYIIRKSVNLSKQAHIIAANIDRAYLLVTLAAPETHMAFIDRFLVGAEAYRIPVTLLFNKMDFYFEEHLPLVDEVMEMYESIGYPCHKISALKQENIEFLREEIKGKQVVVNGLSGTGKSTLINALDSNLNIRTSNISISHLQGQHTTTFAEMHQLQTGGYIIDTPGIRSFGMYDLDRRIISHYFPEMRELLNKCKFHNCLHLNEPDCVIKEAVEEGEIHSSRYATYVDLMSEEGDEHYR